LGWLSPKLEASYNPYRISDQGIILDLVLGGFLESAVTGRIVVRTEPETRCRTRRVGRARPPGASDRQRTNPNEEPKVTAARKGSPSCKRPA